MQPSWFTAFATFQVICVCEVCLFGCFKYYSFFPFNLKCLHCSRLIVIPPLACLSDVLGPVWCRSRKRITARPLKHLAADSVIVNRVRDFSFLNDWCESRVPLALKPLIQAWFSPLGWLMMVWCFLLVKNRLWTDEHCRESLSERIQKDFNWENDWQDIVLNANCI